WGSWIGAKTPAVGVYSTHPNGATDESCRGSEDYSDDVEDQRSLTSLQRAFGYTTEDLKIVLRPMGAEGLDAVWSMGDDTPVAPFARAPRSLYAFFRQRFAQVTNPPIDPLRESLVMSLRSWVGPRPDLLQVSGTQQALIELESPVLGEGGLAAIRSESGMHVTELDATFPVGGTSLEAALDELWDE